MVNLAYASLARGRTQVQMAELDLVLSPPSEQEQARGKMNDEAMKHLGIGMLAPPPKKPRSSG